MPDSYETGIQERQAESTHLTESEFRALTRPDGMTDAQRLRVLVHAAGCAVCRPRIAGLLEEVPSADPAEEMSVLPPLRSGRQIVALRSLPGEGVFPRVENGGGNHLAYWEIRGVVENTLSPTERDLAEEHLDRCADCKAAVEAQRTFTSQLQGEEQNDLPLPALKNWAERLGSALHEVREWHQRQRDALRGFLPAVGALTAAAAGEEGAGAFIVGDSRVLEIWEPAESAHTVSARPVAGLHLRLTRRGAEYRARVEFTVPEGDPLREHYLDRIVRLEIFDSAGESLFGTAREIAVGGSLLLGELGLTEGATILATIMQPSRPETT